jgi:hypothetical protein
MSVIEIHTFRLAPGADETAFLEADRAVQTDFIPNLPGFIRRTTARGRDGEWLVLTLWGWSDAADDAASLAAGHDATKAFAALVDSDSVVVQRFTTLD